jgi:G2/mitotic-specific cyclin 2
MSQQADISWAHREKLFDWLVSTHNQFRFGQESLFLTFNIIDRFLSLRQVSMSKLQLVGTAAFLVATKFEESMSPSVSQLTCEGMSADEIMIAERYLLRELEWNLS